jgi:DNA-binding response OmpR family regulator
VNRPDLRLLVVDDDPMQLELVQRALGHEGFVVETTSTLAGATAAVERFSPDVVLVDVNIPGMSGEDLRGFVATGGTRARVLLFSASDGSHLKSLAAKLGAYGWLSKSAALPEIARRLREIHTAEGTSAR